MDNKLYFSGDGIMRTVLFFISAVSCIFSIISVVNGGPWLLAASALLTGVFCFAFADSKPLAFALPAAVTVVYFAERIIGVYLKKASTDGASVLLSFTFFAMVFALVATLLVALTVTGVIKNKYVAGFALIVSGFLCYYVFVKSMGFTFLKTYALIFPMALIGLYCAYIKDRKNNGNDAFLMLSACCVIMFAIALIKNVSAGNAMLIPIVLTVLGILELGVIFVYLEGHIKSLFAVVLITLFCTVVEIVVIGSNMNIDWSHIKYYFMYASYVIFNLQAAILLFEGNAKKSDEVLSDEVLSD